MHRLVSGIIMSCRDVRIGSVVIVGFWLSNIRMWQPSGSAANSGHDVMAVMIRFWRMV